jgi:hypothetical protein
MSLSKILVVKTYFAKTMLCFQNALMTPLGLSISVPVVSVVSIKSDSSIWILLVLSAFDFITGIGASYVEKRAAEKIDPSLKEKDLITSDKMKMSILKMVFFGSSILISNSLEETFLVKPIFFSFLERPVTISAITIGFCCSVEVWSIFMENFKRMGFDIVGIIKKMVKTGKELKQITE